MHVDKKGMKSSWRRSAHKLGNRGDTVGVVSLSPMLPPPPSPPLFSALLLSSDKSLPLLDSCVWSMSMFLFRMEVIILLKENTSRFDNVG